MRRFGVRSPVVAHVSLILLILRFLHDPRMSKYHSSRGIGY